jgi:Ca2+-binding EF-hand superfamily protein
MTDDEVIDFKELNRNSKHDMTKFATLFYVEMKPFLDQYKACDSTQKVKFFCNINDNFNEKKFKNLNISENNIIDNIKNRIPLDPQEQHKRVFSIKSSNQGNSVKTDSVNYDILYINQSKENDNTECESFQLKFNKVFDKTSAQVMAPYMAVSNVINNYEGLMLFTFGYSGVGKSYSIFGTKENPGLLYSIFNSIQNITNVKIKIYEIYGMALNKKENFSKNVYQTYINHEINYNNNNYNIDNSYIIDDIGELEGIEIKYNDLEGFLLNLNNITEEIENSRGILNNNNVTYSYGLEDKGINIKTIKKTKNNPDSSRSILCYELIINKDGQNIPFVVLDLPGKEIIIDSFGKEGEALLKIKPNVSIDENFLKNNFYNILNKLDTLSEDESAELFKDIEQNKVNGTINVNYKILKDKVRNRTNLGIRISKLVSDDTTININDIIIKSKNNIQININFKDGDKIVTLEELVNNYILNNTNPLILKQKHYALSKNLEISNQIILPNDGINSTYNHSNLYLGFKNSSLFKEVSLDEYSINQNNNKFTITLNELDDLIPYTQHDNLQNDLSMDGEILKNDINSALNINKDDLNVSYFIIEDKKLKELKKEYIQNVEESNKKSKRANLIRAMQNAINYNNNNAEQNQNPHPILKLTYILDNINDMDYTNSYSNNAEKCFKYTKSAEGIFINENINGIMQLMINKKKLSNHMPTIKDGDNYDSGEELYNGKQMFYNEKNNNSNFNNTLIYDKFYNKYENNINLKKIDNMYAFFVVANISNNERIKQKLICNATKDTDGTYKRDLGWDCDEEKLAKEKDEYLEKEKAAIQNANKERKEDIEFIINELANRDRLRKRDLLISSNNIKNPYFEIINKKFGTGYTKEELEEILKKFKTKENLALENEKFKNKFAVELYNKIQTKLANKGTEDEKKFASGIIKELKKEEYSQDIIKNFREINTNNDGKITKIEFGSALKRKLGEDKNISPNALTLIFNSIDKDRSGSISLQEFIDDIKKQSGQGGGSNDRKLYIREMCKTQVALFRELKDVINKIVAPDS